jgi:hypothetical protein
MEIQVELVRLGMGFRTADPYGGRKRNVSGYSISICLEK